MQIQAHSKSIDALRACDRNLLTGSKDGTVKLWSVDLKELSTFSLTSLPKAMITLRPSVRALAWDKTSQSLWVGTGGADIYKFDGVTDADISRGTPSVMMNGHCDDEVWGLAPHPDKANIVATVGDDKTLRLWDTKRQVMLRSVELPDRSRSVAWSPDGSRIACGLGGRLGRSGSKSTPGGVVVVDAASLQIVAKDTKIKKQTSVVKFSPNGTVIAVGGHDSKVWLYDAKTLKRKKAKLSKSSSTITAFDWSADGSRLQTNDSSYELLFYDSKTGKQITSATKMRDVDWDTWTCTLGWPVQGIWPDSADGTDINSVDRSHSGKLLASADDFGTVKLFNYPCSKEGAEFVTGSGHSSHVTCVKFNANDSTLLSVGGNDRTLMQWSL